MKLAIVLPPSLRAQIKSQLTGASTATQTGGLESTPTWLLWLAVALGVVAYAIMVTIRLVPLPRRLRCACGARHWALCWLLFALVFDDDQRRRR
jgi:hypothetical protein